MEDSMLKRLDATKKRLAEIDEELADESVMRDISHFKNLSKERSNIADICEKYDEYSKYAAEREEALAMMSDSDSELAELGKQEFHSLNQKLEDIEQELHLMLVPKDPNDDKNIIVEIRGAVGGDELQCFRGGGEEYKSGEYRNGASQGGGRRKPRKRGQKRQQAEKYKMTGPVHLIDRSSGQKN